MKHRLWVAVIACVLPVLVYGVALTTLNAAEPGGAARDGAGSTKISRLSVSGDDEAAPTGRWALLIGVGEYLDTARLPNLASTAEPDIPDKDVRDLAKALADTGYRVAALSSSQKDGQLKPLRANILREALQLTTDERIGESDTVLVYFSGHGFVVDAEGKLVEKSRPALPGDKAYLAAHDTYADRAADTGVLMADFAGCLRRCKAKNKVLILDACRSGNVGEAFSARDDDGDAVVGLLATTPRLDSRAIAAKVNWPVTRLQPVLDRLVRDGRIKRGDGEAYTVEGKVEGKSFVMMSSCLPSESSYLLERQAPEPDGINSTYTYFLTKGLRGKADGNRDGETDYTELFRYVYREVTAWAKRLDRKQTPQMDAGGITENIVIAGKLTPGRLALNATPWADVWVDGQHVGMTPKMVVLHPGRHIVVFRNPGRLAPIEKVADLPPNRTVPVWADFPSK